MPCSRDGEREGRRRRREGGQYAVSVSRPTRASASREAAARWRTTGSDPPRKRTLRGNRAAGARTSRQSTNVMERSVVNEHSSCHICERRMATDDGPLWSPRQPLWRPAKPKPKLLRVLTSSRTAKSFSRISTLFLVMRALLSDCLLIRFSTISAGYGKFNEFQQVKIGVKSDLMSRNTDSFEGAVRELKKLVADRAATEDSVIPRGTPVGPGFRPRRSAR